jgi:hypothetical protein
MTVEQVLERGTYLSWAADFLLLGIVLPIATVAYRRFAAGPLAISGGRTLRVRSPIRASGSAPGRRPSAH